MAQEDHVSPDPNVELDTQDKDSTDPILEEGDGHSGSQGESDLNVDSPTADDSGQDESKSSLAERREQGKLQQVQRELERARQQLSRLETIEKKAMESPDKYRRALVDYSGWDEETADKYVEGLKARGVWRDQAGGVQPGATQRRDYGSQAVPQGTPQQPTVDPFLAAQSVYQQMEQSRQIRERFFSEVPEMDPANVPPERVPTMRTFSNAIEAEAARRLQENPDQDVVDILVSVYKDFTGKTDEELAKAREQGVREGYVRANAGKAGALRPSKGGKVAPERSHGLTAEELKLAEAEGLTAEEFAKLKDPITQVE